MLNNNSKWAKSLAALRLWGLVAACSRNGGQTLAAGTVDSAVVRTTTGHSGSRAQESRSPRADSNSVTKALRL